MVPALLGKKKSQMKVNKKIKGEKAKGSRLGGVFAQPEITSPSRQKTSRKGDKKCKGGASPRFTGLLTGLQQFLGSKNDGCSNLEAAKKKDL